MWDDYNDIRSRIPEEPKWWDQNGCPRYNDPIPSNCSDIYAEYVAFMEIACQTCDHRFIVEASLSMMRRTVYKIEWNPLDLHYGNPPNIGCCPGGATMTSTRKMLISAWKRDHNATPSWVQTHSMIPLEDDWGDTNDNL